jgi:hypothetical protein
MNAGCDWLNGCLNAFAALAVLVVSVAHTSVAAQVRHTVYGVAPAPPVVGLPAGYIAVLPAEYQMVTVSGARYYYAGGIHYRATFYQGRTCYMRVRL